MQICDQCGIKKDDDEMRKRECPTCGKTICKKCACCSDCYDNYVTRGEGEK